MPVEVVRAFGLAGLIPKRESISGLLKGGGKTAYFSNFGILEPTLTKRQLFWVANFILWVKSVTIMQ
jgi:hypothetical protein